MSSLKELLTLSRRVECTYLAEGIETHQVAKVAVTLVREFIVLPLRDASLTLVSFRPNTLIEVLVKVGEY